MKTKHFILLLLFILSFATWSQELEGITVKDSLGIEKLSGGYRFYRQGVETSKSNFSRMMYQDSAAYRYYLKGNHQNIFSNLLGVVGGAGIGWFIGGMFFGDESQWIIGGIGFVSLIVTFPLSTSAENNFKKSVNVYNQGIKKENAFLDRSELNISINPKRIGINLKF